MYWKIFSLRNYGLNRLVVKIDRLVDKMVGRGKDGRMFWTIHPSHAYAALVNVSTLIVAVFVSRELTFQTLLKWQFFVFFYKNVSIHFNFCRMDLNWNPRESRGLGATFSFYSIVVWSWTTSNRYKIKTKSRINMLYSSKEAPRPLLSRGFQFKSIRQKLKRMDTFL